MEDASAHTNDGAFMDQWTYWGGDNQMWQVIAVGGGYYKLINGTSGKALEIYGSSMDDGTNLDQWTYTGTDNQKWQINDVGGGFYSLINKNSGLAMEVSHGGNTNNSTLIDQWGYWAGDNQKWAFTVADTTPPAAEVAGYTNRSCYEDFSSTNAVDSYNTHTGSHTFYPLTFWSVKPMNPDQMVVTNGCLILGGVGGGGICTAYPSGGTNYVGKAYASGAYFEATISFDPSQVTTNASSWPAFWSDPIEAMFGAWQWPGQATNYTHSVEMDFMEFNPAWTSGNTNIYSGTIHEWYGQKPYADINNGGESGANFNNNHITVYTGTDWTVPHKIGCLWKPWTASSAGYIQMWFDGEPTTDTVTWTTDTIGNPPPNNAAWQFARTDQSHFLPILSTGDICPMKVYEFQVWQK